MGDGVTSEELDIFRNNVFGISLSATGLSEVCSALQSGGAGLGKTRLSFLVPGGGGGDNFAEGHSRHEYHIVSYIPGSELIGVR